MNAEPMRKYLATLWTEQDGVTAIEYALLAALIVIVIVAAIGRVGVEVGKLFAKIAAIFPLVP